MSQCHSIQSKFSDYLDSRLTGHEMQKIAAHLAMCRECSSEWAELKQTQSVLASLGPVPQPDDLLLRVIYGGKVQPPFDLTQLASQVHTLRGMCNDVGIQLSNTFA